MITIYTASGNTSCTKTLKWFKENQIRYVERKIDNNHLLTEYELRKILQLTDNGFEDIISFRSAEYKRLNFNIEECSVKEAISLIVSHPELLKKPIIIENNKFLVGFNIDSIRSFVPGNRRTVQLNGYYFSNDNDFYNIIVAAKAQLLAINSKLT